MQCGAPDLISHHHWRGRRRPLRAISESLPLLAIFTHFYRKGQKKEARYLLKEFQIGIITHKGVGMIEVEDGFSLFQSSLPRLPKRGFVRYRVALESR